MTPPGPPTNPLALFGNVKQRFEQDVADKMMDELVPIFLRVFSHKSGRRSVPYNPRIGKRIPVKVLQSAEYAVKLAEGNNYDWANDIAALVRYQPAFVERKLQENRASLSGRYPEHITPTTKIDPRDYGIVFLENMQVDAQKAAANYLKPDDTLYIQVGNTDISVIAHELCHAYTHANWNEFQVEISVFGPREALTKLDEGVTSEMANLVLFEWSGAKLAPRGGRPNGYVGYDTITEKAAAKFLRLSDGMSSTPGPTAIEAYFGGRITVKTLDTKAVERSAVLLGSKGKKAKVSEMILGRGEL